MLWPNFAVRSAGALLGVLIYAGLVVAAPCDIYAAGGTPCIAAHSTTRLLLTNYFGPLYRLWRPSDGNISDVYPLRPSGVANITTQDEFCKHDTCFIQEIFDQINYNGTLRISKDFNIRDSVILENKYVFYALNLSNAIAAPVTLNGKRAYGVSIGRGTGYQGQQTNSSAWTDTRGSYAVFDNTRSNTECCFNYGLANLNDTVLGANRSASIEALRFGAHLNSSAPGESVPRVLFDMGPARDAKKYDMDIKPVSHRFTTAMLKTTADRLTLRGGNAEKGDLMNIYSVPQPPSARKNMKEQKDIVLGFGIHNSYQAQGTFYEGVLVSGHPDDETENKVQEDIVKAGYKALPQTSGPEVPVKSQIYLQATNPNYTYYCMIWYPRQKLVAMDFLSKQNGTSVQKYGQWTVHQGLSNAECRSFESVVSPGWFLAVKPLINYTTSYNHQIYAHKKINTQLFNDSATFCNTPGLIGTGSSFYSWINPAMYLMANHHRIFMDSYGVPVQDDRGNAKYDASFFALKVDT